MSFLFSCCRKGPGQGQYYEVQNEDSDGKMQSEFVSNLSDAKNINKANKVFRVKKSDYEELISQHTGSAKWTDT